jgi:hypothetical protein
MRPYFLRLAVVGGLLAGTAAAQPPTIPGPLADAKKLKDAVDALRKDREGATKEATGDVGGADERMLLRLKLLDKLKELPGRFNPPPVILAPPPTSVPPAGTTPDPAKPDPWVGTVPLDPLRVAQNLYKAGDIEAAYRAIQMQKPDTLSPDDRTFAQYLSACCLRRMGKLPQAAALYREIADGKRDPFITESALSQLSMIRTVQEIEGQLEQLRANRKVK